MGGATSSRPTAAGLGDPQPITGDLFALQALADVPLGELASELLFAMPAEPAGFRRLTAAPEPVLSAQLDSDIDTEQLIHGVFEELGRSIALAPSGGPLPSDSLRWGGRQEVVG
jgi:hypothetical protein